MADLYERLRQIKERRSKGGGCGPGGGSEVRRPLREVHDVAPGDDWRKLAPAVYVRDRMELLPRRWSDQLDPGGVWRDVSPILLRGRAGGAAVAGAPVATAPLATTPVFIDIETTGLSSGAGTVAFLIGLGRFVTGVHEDAPAVQVRQYFLADLGAEMPFMEAVLADMQQECNPSAPRLYVTYNGATFDLPVLRSRSIMTRNPFPEAPHLDLLPLTRRLYREKIGSCTLGDVETHVLYRQRLEDIPGREVPERYLSFLRGASRHRLRPVLEHHYADIAHMAWLALHFNGLIHRRGVDSGGDDQEDGEPDFLPPDQAGLFRLRLEREPPAQRPQTIRDLSLEVFQGGIPERRDWYRLADLLVTVLRRDQRWDELILILEELCRRRGSVNDYVDLAVQLEHRRREYSRALSLVTTAAVRYGWDQSLQHRASRLHRRLQGYAGTSSGTPRQSGSS